jgi:hypothetical protein
MSTNSARTGQRTSGPGGPSPATVRAWSQIRPIRGTPEGRYLDGPGKIYHQRLGELQEQRTSAAARRTASEDAAQRAEDIDRSRRQNQRGGDRLWLLRLFVPVAVLAEVVTAYVGMEALVASVPLAEGLSALAALIGGGMACIFANRRLNKRDVPLTARILEGIFVGVMTMLRYDSLHVQGAGPVTAVGAAALAALISALGLLGIEEIIVETRTFGLFASTLRLSWSRWRSTTAVAGLARIAAELDAAAERLQQHFLDYLLKTEGLPLAEARQRSRAFSVALTSRED